MGLARQRVKEESRKIWGSGVYLDFGNDEKGRCKRLLLLQSQHAVGMKAGQNNLGRATCREQKLRVLNCC